MARILRFPDHGCLLVATDLQGNLADFLRMTELFRAELHAQKGDVHLLFTGDLIHGPHLTEEEWPDYLGSYYQDQSAEIMDKLRALSAEFPENVHALIGNHEHAHVGGPHTAKFATDDVLLLESRLGMERAARLRSQLRTFPLVAWTPCGVVFTHGAPAAAIGSPRDIEAAELEGVDVFAEPVVGPILWARTASADVARGFLRALEARIAVFGHDVAVYGFERIGDEQLRLSSSFGVIDVRKRYLRLDLGGQYQTVNDLREASELLCVYPPDV